MNIGWEVSQVLHFSSTCNMQEPLFMNWEDVCNLQKSYNIRCRSNTGCIKETDVDYSLGDDNDIAYQQGLTEQGCAELAAATEGGLFWSYHSYQSKCWVKKTTGGWKYELYAGLVSGNKECGVAGVRIRFSQKAQSFFRQRWWDHCFQPERSWRGKDKLHPTM